MHTGAGGSAASLRVHEIFSHCPVINVWDGQRSEPCLIYLIAAGNVRLPDRQMNNIPEKHMGVLSDGRVWHYSNRRRKVVSEDVLTFKNWHKTSAVELFTSLAPISP